MALALSLALAGPVDAGTIVVSGDGNITSDLSGGAFDNQTWFMNLLGTGTQVLVDVTTLGFTTLVNNFYNTQGGVTSTVLAGEVTAASLAGVDLFVSPASTNTYSAAEIAALSAFLGGGGTVLLMAEHSGFPAQIANVNAVLSGLGSAMSVSPATNLCGFNTLSGAQIAADPFNAGVLQFQMGCTSQVLGGTPLFFTSPGVAMVAYESTNAAVPEPATLLLLGTGLGLTAARRRLKKRG